MSHFRRTQPPVSHAATCPACGHHVAVTFFRGEQPLATIAWPASAEAARSMPMLPLDFVRCVDCGHVFNRAFDYAAVPYTDKPNLMFNKGALWSGFLKHMQTLLLSRLPERPVVVEIGHGDGGFIAALAAARPAGRYYGFDPNGAAIGDGAVELRAELFEPGRHLAELRPDLIVSRHVMEHLANPLGFLQSLCFAVAHTRADCLLYLEVPCIDRVIETGRTVDLYYEHNSQFTTQSFSRMLMRCAAVVQTIGHGYDGEVIYGLARMSAFSDQIRISDEATRYETGTQLADRVIRGQLMALHASGRRIAIWGGTGKSAAFMNRYGLDAERFPIVVDSDPAKIGTFVPGTGQEIRSRDLLEEHPADVVIVPPQWRAADIVVEMVRNGIAAEAVVIEHGGRLVDYFDDAHPYHRIERPTAWRSAGTAAATISAAAAIGARR
jgi:C-methyltransferase C-terminal domain/Methyltransferase domain